MWSPHNRQLAARKSVTLFVLGISLDFSCAPATDSSEFVEAVVGAMLDALRRGLTERFRAVMYHEITEMVVYTGLRIRGLRDGSVRVLMDDDG